MTTTLLFARRAVVALLALVAVLASAVSARADIRLQAVRSFDAQEGTPVPQDRIVSFDDAGACAPGEYAIRIDWGDGNASAGQITFTDQIIGIDLEPKRCIYEASGRHTYRTAMTAPLSVSVCRAAECRSSGGGTANVGEAPIAGAPEEFGARAGHAFSGVVAKVRDANELAQASDYTAVVDWGDGTTSAGSVTGRAGHFAISGTHAYAEAGARAVRVTLLQGGADRLAIGGTVQVAPAEDESGAAAPAPAPASATPGRIVANSSRRARPALRLGLRRVSRRGLAKGLPLRLSVPASLRTVTISVVTATGTPRRLGRVTLRLRGGRVAGGARTLSARVRLPITVRRKLRAGSYALQVRAGAGGLMVAQFRVTR